MKLTKSVYTISRSALVLLPALGLISAAAWAEDLSKYRNFQLGTDLATVAKEAGMDSSQAKLIHSRPALLQELAWRPQSLGPVGQSEPSKDVTFSFYNGELFQIAVNYDRYGTEGLTASDMVDAISATYGTASKPNMPIKSAPGQYGDPEEVFAQWQDSQYRFDLIRSSYGPSFRLVGVLKRLDAPAQAAATAGARIDDKEAPEREAQRIAAENEEERSKLEKARLLNKPKFHI